MTISHAVDAGVATVVLDRPDRLNAITTAMARELAGAITELGGHPEVRVVVVKGAGENFCAGGDFDEVGRLRAEGAARLSGLFSAFRAACDAIAAVEAPVVAAVRGVAAAGGFELMQAADIVLVSDDARIADSHVKFGMIPGGGSTARLPRIVGTQQALGLLLSGDEISGREAVALGLAYRTLSSSEFDEEVDRFARKLATRQRESVVTIKRLVRSGLGQPLHEALDAEQTAVVEHIIAAGSGTDRFASRPGAKVRT
ncbi:enoyl-CoA hydratase/isomerase family protein [Mycobacterium paraintracellulare]|uniref:Enoyl-CoA hydratase n=1 Tax=Mycobacterium paraintracellulare TaxID=1138383 RepID=A0ABN6AR49_9MYCO|nr:enoyl-CoA hydratase/isomerase family protein [Mycobacterium paraintracellulare]AFC53156.1 enoyl-CoA hydratase/isomerase family protein [Mycobacterium paraintracellulare]OSC23279.1 enoyl-CoA hydratase [Mycobacterium paraintracellulare]BBY71323.1 enoyl-CoA hydratase [Mycobacterium paraintracellulare]